MRWFWIVLVLLAIPVSVGAQNTSAWEVVLYSERGEGTAKTGEFTVLTPNGVSTRYPVPPQVYANGAVSFIQAEISPDRRYGVFSFYTGTGTSVPPIAIVDLSTGRCCTYVNSPIPDPESYDLGALSPDGRQIAVSYLGFVDRANYVTQGGIMTVDIASGQVMANVSTDVLTQSLPQTFVAYTPLGDWKPDGIRWVPSCYACEGIIESPWYIWNPQTNAVSQSTNEYFSIFGDRLDVTGELLITANNSAYPQGYQTGMLPPANVVEWYATGMPPAPEVRAQNPAFDPVVYFNPNNLDLQRAYFVADGQGFVTLGTELAPRAVAVFRDGSQGLIDATANEQFIAGTPDGFITQDPNFWVVYYQYANNGAWTRIPLEQFSSTVRAVDKPALGASVTQPFQLVAVPLNAQTAGNEPLVPPQQQSLPTAVPMTCPGFMQSRLVAGGMGRVTPGSPNNLRMSPSRDAEVGAIIPGGATFTVLSGPQCDPAGIAWWQVEYDGIVGWTAEGQGTSYFVEPA